MASVTKSVSGSVSTFAITDNGGTVATIAVNAAPTTGITCTFSGGALRQDGVAMVVHLCQQLQTGLIPGGGAQGLT